MARRFQHLMDSLRLRISDGRDFVRYAAQGKRLAERNTELEQELADLRQIEAQCKQAEAALQAQEATAHRFQEQLKALHEINIRLTQVATLDELYRLAVEMGRSELGFDRVGIFLTDETMQEMIGTFATDVHGNTRDMRHVRWSLRNDSLIRETMIMRGRISYGNNVPLYDNGELVGHGWQAMGMLWNGEKAIGWVSADNLIHQQPLREEQLEILSLYGAMLGHLSVQKQTEMDLRLNQQRLRLALQAGRLSVWDWKRGVDQLVYDESLLPSRHPDVDSYATLINYIAPEDLQRVANALRRCVEQDVPVQQEFRLIKPDTKEVLWVFALGQPYHDENGKVAGIIGVSQDITERKKVEEQAMELALQRERMALLTEFMSNISHDLKTPLAVINTSLYLLERLDDADKRAEKISNIRSQAVLLEKFIQDILTISRLDFEPGVLMKPMDMSDTIRAVHARMLPAAEHKNLQFHLELPDRLPLIRGDARELDRVLANLVENAINYTQQGSVTLRGRAGEKCLIVEVVDSGIGIEPGDIHKIFSRFYRTPAARNALQGGTGLGLAIVERIVELHQGKIEVESVLGKGSTFRMRLPILPTP